MDFFQQEIDERVREIADNDELLGVSAAFMRASVGPKYSYNFRWLGRPIIQYPQDMVAIQELVWLVQPELIVETGIAHGGSLILSASLLELNAACGGPSGARVLGIDIDIRPHNREAIEKHPMAKRIDMIQGSSVDPDLVARVRDVVAGSASVLVLLDSNHTHKHVLHELRAYAPLATKGSYCVVFDTILEDLPKELSPDRTWGPGNSPRSAVREFLSENSDFEVDEAMDARLLLSAAPGGYLKKVR